MSGLFAKIKQFSRSPQGQRAIASVRRAASDPRKREQAGGMLRRLRGRRAASAPRACRPSPRLG
ncbi:hypothetical protein [Streptomyces sp. NBC_01294]|uniref:hypothetical protein n=1 Tax=Streptomyces sp. NBC_01294 TaxID=2903815 RepID=UPI002DD9F9D4|nr:hypothetical protein [Streptomyces sp. NBC_01294]WRZ61545.1 hypothetical protein OG534_36790 [Streptomyces sp. NBC_01294]